MIDAFLMVCLGAVAVMGAITLVNVFSMRSLRPAQAPDDAPRVSVLIPARNEERSLGLALETLAAQDYPDYEVIVLDDNSDDGTGAIARAWAQRDSRFRVIGGDPLPPGWVGKSWACHQLSRDARGSLLLFLDADTTHAPGAVSAAVAALQRSGAGLLTAIPDQRMLTFWEKVLLPLLHFSALCYLPIPLVSLTRHPKLAMANGQFLLFRRDAYEAIGGHGAVRTAIVEDVWLSREVKRCGYGLAIRDGGALIACRMYRSFGEIWRGFSKNLFAGFHYSLPMFAAVVLFTMATSILPFLLVAAGLLAGAEETFWFSAAAAQAVLVVAIRVMIALRLRLDLWPAVTHPVAMAVFVGIAVTSVWWVLRGGGSRWKGRTYDFRNHTTAVTRSL
jgi:chlorobactene glucosyltransferase